MSDVTSAFECWDAIVAAITAASIPPATPTARIDVGFGWPGTFAGTESVKVSGLLDADDETRETKCAYRETITATVLVSTGLGHRDATAAKDRLSAMTGAVQAAINATVSPGVFWPTVKSWRCAFVRASIVPGANGVWLAQAELAVRCTAMTRETA